MKPFPLTLIASALATGLLAASPTYAEPLRYWGRSPEGTGGWIELGRQQYYQIAPGTDIPAWGRVKEVHDDRLVVEQIRTESEKDALRQQGLFVYDEMEIHIPREDTRHPKTQSQR